MCEANENAIQKVEQPTNLAQQNHLPIPAGAPLMTRVAMMMERGIKIDTDAMSKMQEMAEKFEANEARKAYHVAMAEFKADPPKIIKDLQNKQYESQYASLGNVTNVIGTELSKFGLSAKWLTSQKDNGWPEVECVITHIQGHSESTSLSAPPDDSGKKNPIQRIISTVTYLERATLLALTGLATYNQDDDGNGAGDDNKNKEIPKPIAQEQAFIDAVVEKLPAVEGKVWNNERVGLFLRSENKGVRPVKMIHLEKATEHVVQHGKQELLMDAATTVDSSEFERKYDIPADEDSGIQFDGEGNPL